jgi:hypothetical protein
MTAAELLTALESYTMYESPCDECGHDDCAYMRAVIAEVHSGRS